MSSAPADASSAYWVRADADFSMRRISPIRHNYHQHPLMQLDRLEQLAQGLMPLGKCRFIVPGATQASKFEHHSKPADGRSLADVFQRIEEPGSWIALYDVQTDPVYSEFLWQVMASANMEGRGETPFDVRGFIFISAPPSVTPFHIDREHNFWLQIRGRKMMSVWDHLDRDTVSGPDVEAFINHGVLDNVRLSDDKLARVQNFDCAPGDGVYFPSTTPHMTRTDTSWVTPGDGVVISIGVVFYTERTRRQSHVHALNTLLRRIGLNPRAGASETVDRLKAPFGRLLVGLRRRFTSYTPPPGF